MTEQINVTPPGDEFKKMMQDFVIDLTWLRYEIDKGNYKMIKDYVNKLNRLKQNLLEYATEEQARTLISISRDIYKTKVLEPKLNLFSGTTTQVPTPNFEDYMQKLDEYEFLLRMILKRQNFLVKSVEKTMRLT